MANAMNHGVASWDAPIPLAPDARLLAEMLAPRPVERPPIRIPRSLRRTASDSDLQAAADMLAKLRRRDDSRRLAAGAPAADAEHALDVAVGRLLMVMGR